MPHLASRQSTLDHAEAGCVQQYPVGYLRSYADIVTILPTLPAGWPSGKACGLRLRGGDAVDLEWRDRVLSSMVLHALATREVTIDVPRDGPVRIMQAGGTVTVVAL